ncbi:MAG: protein kinase family protein [Candidatus Abyssobacteria bacterium SURF_5]|uniref:Protein kinase family protein n=1 Tax=Abyssobacteria bacterium (strain SURF_5) TaxID=2093360 RepID=A0A3A4NRP3_ABYX5|nr:MAG: protein kinase family protein [Candidatus Abyssubacteria bacterium SURF_5]
MGKVLGEKSRDWLCRRAAEFSSIPVEDLKVVSDTTEFMNIHRGHILELDGRHFLVTGYIYEARFGLSDEPKYWVKKAIDLEAGSQQIVKLSHREEFHMRIGRLRIRCYRNPHKEAQVLELVRGNPNFMQGYSLFDGRGNEVRVVDIIRGKSIYDVILNMNTTHEEYFYGPFPGILRKVAGCIASLQFLHDHNLCHGDIRNDHILIEQDTGLYRWIDFDLTQDFSDLDIWSVGNILQFCVGMGMKTFREVLQSDDYPASVKNDLCADDASAFYEHRIMNLQKLFPYIPDSLNDILLHFAVNTNRFYTSISQIVSDIDATLEEMSSPTDTRP